MNFVDTSTGSASTLSKVEWVDTHAHLNFPEFSRDYHEVVERAKKAGVTGIICVGSDIENSRRAIEIASEYDEGVYAAVGIHPSEAGNKIDWNNFLDLARSKKVVGIGETGLDYFKSRSEKQIWSSARKSEKIKDDQRQLFKLHLELAKQIRKPLILHCRDARDDFIKIIKKYAGDFEKGILRGVVHCFTGDWAFAKEILDLGLLISYIGIITFTKREEQLEAAKKIPLDKMMIETDSPLVAPEPYRGQRNEPAYVIEIAKKIAELKGITLEEVAMSTTRNAVEFFGIQLFDGDSVVAR